jgi:hypothetical protein
LFHACVRAGAPTQTDMMQQIVVSCNFANAPKNGFQITSLSKSLSHSYFRLSSFGRKALGKLSENSANQNRPRSQYHQRTSLILGLPPPSLQRYKMLHSPDYATVIGSGIAKPAVMLKIQVLWAVTPCLLVNIYRRFEGARCLRLQSPSVQKGTSRGK